MIVIAAIRKNIGVLALVGLSLTYALSLDYVSLNPDELFSIYLAKQDLSFICGYAWHADTNPPLHTLLLKAWSGLFGYSATSTRALSLLAALGAAAVVDGIARVCAPRSFRHRVLPSLIFLLSTTVAFYALDTRPYAIWLLFVSLSMLGLAKFDLLFRDDPRPQTRRVLLAGLLYASGAILGVYTHVTTVPYIAAANVTFLWMWLRRRPSRSLPELVVWGALQVAIVLAILPQLLVSMSQLDSHILDWIPPTKAASLPRPIVEVIAGNYAGHRLIVVIPLLLVTIATWLMVGFRQRKDDAPLELLFLLSASGFVVILALSLVRPLLVAHTFAWILIPISLVNASATTWKNRRFADVAAWVLIVSTGINTGWYTWKTPQYLWREYLAEASSRIGPTDVLVVVGNTPITELAYYLPEQLGKTRRWVPAGYTRYEQTSAVIDDRVFAAQAISGAELRHDLEAGRTVWLIERDAPFLVAQVETAFAGEVGALARPASQWRYGTISMTQYLSAVAGPRPF